MTAEILRQPDITPIISRVSKMMGLAVVFLLFAVYAFGMLAKTYYQSAIVEHIDKPVGHIFAYAIVGLSAAGVALIFASISLGRHPDGRTVLEWWLTFGSFTIALTIFGLMLYKLLVEMQILAA